MFILSRQTDQSVAIGDEIIVTVQGIDNDHVDLDLDAPITFIRWLNPDGEAIPADQRVVRLEVGQSVWLGNSIQIVVIKLLEGKVRLGIHCPDDMAITRPELRR